ncbi:hypothetical protein [Exiguobacterium sp. s131]|uniref:hypothetical protein n=1 Tax=Exiguobacterium sp. s131 TaxID=2751278 RepID=UPI001BE5349A|nr:hypothetical protein [Exiguobacterium sp. s131]
MKKIIVALLFTLFIGQFSNQYTYAETNPETEQAVEEKFIELLREENVNVKEITFNDQIETEVELENFDGELASLKLSIEPGAESFPITVTEFDGEVTNYEVKFTAEAESDLLDGNAAYEDYELLYLNEDQEEAFESDPQEAEVSILPIAIPIGLAITPAVVNALVQAGGIIIVSGVAHVIETKAKKSKKYSFFQAALSGGGLYVGKGISKGEAVTRLKRGKDIWATTKSNAKAAASGGDLSEKPIHEVDKYDGEPPKGRYYHYHPFNRTLKCHAFYGSPVR